MSMPSSLSQRLTQITESLRATIAAHASKHWAVIPLIVQLHGYLRRVAVRFASLTERLAKGRPIPPRAPRPDRVAATPKRPPLPQTFAWLSQLAPETNVFGSQLRHLLASPEMRELLEASPQAAKLLRPLCRMLAIGPGPDPNIPPALFPPPKPRPAVARARPEPVKPAKPAAPVTDIVPPPANFARA